MYKTYVRPTLEYASSVWDPHTIDLISHIEMVQRRAARFVKADYSQQNSVTLMLCTEPPMAVSSGTPCTQQSHHAVQDHQWVCRHPCCSTLPVSLTRPDQRPPPTIQTTTLQNSYFQHSFFPSVVCLWNALPATVVSAPSPETFRSHLAPLTLR